MAEPAPSERKAAPSDETSAGTDPGRRPAEDESAPFTNTKQHAANAQDERDNVERFANTKLNIALINDPEKGPRFTMTKRVAGLADEKGGETEATAKAAPKSAFDHRNNAPKSEGAISEAPPAQAKTVGPCGTSLEKTRDRPADRTRAKSPPPSSSAASPSSVPPAAIAPSKVPIDSAKTFVGLNGTYYDESWRWMDWRGTRRSWNWPAALSFGHWFAYRRLYALAGVYFIWLSGLAAASVNNVPIIALIMVTLALAGLTGVYGNRLYFLSFRRTVGHITRNGKGSYEELQGQLAASGGTSVIAAGIMGMLSIAGIIGTLYATFHLRGAFHLNFWPFF